MGEPELGYVSLIELRTVRGKLRLPIKRDLLFSVRPGRSSSCARQASATHRRDSGSPSGLRPLRPPVAM